MPTRSRNPVQMIQGYVERAETVTINTSPQQIINVQKSYPGATVSVLLRKPDGITTELAKIFNRDGTEKTNPITLPSSTAYYSFYAQPGRYDIEFSDAGITTPFKLEDVPVESLVFNVRDYGAKGDGATDDTAAIRKALETMIAANTATDGVGTLFFPNGRYMVGMTGGPFQLPSGILVQGTNSVYSGDGTAGNCQIVLTTQGESIFQIMPGTFKISLRDIGLTTVDTDTLPGSFAIKAKGRNPGQDPASPYDGIVTQVEFENLVIWGFERGISVEAVGIHGQPGPTVLPWDFTNVRVSRCTIVECNSGVYLDSGNTDFWKIMDSRIGANQNGNALHFVKVGIITIDSVLGAGNAPGSEADAFIYLSPAHGTVTLINLECEGFNKSLHMAPGANPALGNINWPILALNCALGPQVYLNSNCDYVSVGSCYQPTTVQTGPSGTDVMVFSFGDIIRAELGQPLPDNDFQITGNSRVAARANRFRVDFGQPARFGGQPGQPAERLPGTALAIALFETGQTQVALCNAAGVPLINLRADDTALHFEHPLTDTRWMSLAYNGDLYVAGKVFENSII